MGARIKVRLVPRSSRDKILGWDGETAKISVRSPPVDGEANRALLRFLAKALGVKISSLSLAQGAHSRDKSVEIQGLEEEELKRELGRLALEAEGKGKKDRA